MKNTEEKTFFVAVRIPEPTWSLDAAANGKAAVKLFDEEHSHSRSKKYWPVLIKDILHPQGSFDPMWNIIFIISCVLAVSLDPLFFYIPHINWDGKCLQLDKTLQTAALMLRSMTDLSYIVHIIFQTRTLVLSEVDAYSGASKVKSDTVSLKRMGGLVLGKKILQSSIPIDILCILPLPQVVILIFFSKMRGSGSLNTRKFLSSLVLLQYVPRVLRIYLSCKNLNKNPSLEIWVKGVFNFFLYILASHVLGAFWYFFSVQRVTACWQYACAKTRCKPSTFHCDDISYGDVTFLNELCPINQPNATVFDFGIFLEAIQSDVLGLQDYPQKFLKCFWWGLRNLSSLGQNLQTSTYAWENLFAVSISIIGLLLFLYLIGNLQTYMQLSTTRSEKLRQKMKMKDLEIELWLSRNGLPKELKAVFMENLQRKLEKNKEIHVVNMLSILPLEHKNNIKYHLCLAMLKKVPMLQTVDEQVLKVICENLKPVTYNEESYMIREGELLDKMLFITQGIVWTYTSNNGIDRSSGLALRTRCLMKSDFCGEELLDWASKCTSFSDIPISTRIVKAHTKVEAFALMANDLKTLVSKFWWHFNKDMPNSREELLAATSIQAAWRHNLVKRSHNRVKRRSSAVSPLYLIDDGGKSQNFSTPL
ncbi:cyclic nucleotide-gated ion channel 1-like [Pyrus communis]|uniref:cyclic nucleotide-gated ion channel 1-like n=1 Tax=Pyrus communis TaxID=23211 RepID=UPI0035BEE418